MIRRIYEMEDLTEAAEMLRKGPPWWLHAALFGLIAALLVAGALLGGNYTKRAGGQTRPQSMSATAGR